MLFAYISLPYDVTSIRCVFPWIDAGEGFLVTVCVERVKPKMKKVDEGTSVEGEARKEGGTAWLARPECPHESPDKK